MNRLERAREIVETARLGHPGAVELATFVSLAVRVESELLRTMRLEVLPRLSAAAEADLWFGPLVRLRGPDGIALNLDVLEILRADLKERWLADGERQLVERAWRVTQRVHRDTSPALVLEERVAWFALTGDLLSAEAELDRAVKELATRTRRGITGWYAQAWSRLPAEVRSTRAGWLLYQASGRPGPVRIRPAAVPDDLLSYDLTLALAGVDDVKFGVRRDGDLIELGDVDSAGAVAMLVPDTDPRIVELRWPDEPARSAEMIAVPSGQTIRREIGRGRLQLRTARGTLYELVTQYVRRYLVAVGVADYTWRSSLPGIPRGIRDLVTRFEQFGYELALRELSDDPTGEQFIGRLRTWLTDPARRASDVVILYWSGHSAVADGHHYLFMSDSDHADAESPGQSAGAVIATVRLGQMLATRIPNRLLVILDTSYAAQGVQELADASGGRDLWALASAGAAEQAYDEGFVDAFLHALDDEIAPSGQQYLALDSLVESVNRRLGAVRPEQHTFLQLQASAGWAPFFPNPRYRLQEADNVFLSAADPDFAEHFVPRARGVADASEPGWYFTGRTAALRDLVNFLSAGTPQTLVVTGGPGSGKSAVLGRLVVLADRDFRRTVPFSDIPPETIPPAGSVDAAIYAAGKSLSDVITALAAAAGVSDRPDAQALFSAIARRPTPFVIVLDAFDEAADPLEIAQHLLQPLVSMPNVRLIVGTRHHYIRDIDPSASAIMIDLDLPQYLSPADLSDCARRILVAGDGRSAPTPYADQPGLATAVANAIAEAASPSFLAARIAARTLAAQTTAVDPADPAWRASLPGAADMAFLPGRGRRFLLTGVVSRYQLEPSWNREELAEDLQRMVRLFTELGYQHVPVMGLDPTWLQIQDALREFCTSADRRPDDYLAVYLAGHGEILPVGDTGAEPALLPADANPADLGRRVVKSADLAEWMLAETPVRRLLLIVDACYSGMGGPDFARNALARIGTPARLTEPDGAGVVVITATQPAQHAVAGAFTTAFARAVRSQATAGHVPVTLSIDAVINMLRADPALPASQQVHWSLLAGSGTIPDFLPSPRRDTALVDPDLPTEEPKGEARVLAEVPQIAQAPDDSGGERIRLAAALDDLASELTAASRKLKRTFPGPGQDVASFWRAGLEEMRGYIDKVDHVQVACQSIVAEQSRFTGREDTALPALRQLEQAVSEAIGAILVAIHSLEVSDQPFAPGSSGDYYIKAADQLAELAKFCSGLAVHMRGAEVDQAAAGDRPPGSPGLSGGYPESDRQHPEAGAPGYPCRLAR